MTLEEVKSIAISIGTLITAFTTIFMVFYRSKEFQNYHENILNKRLKSSIEYHEKFVRNSNKIEYSKNVQDAAACDLVGNGKVDAFLVNFLLELHEKKLVDINEMMGLFHGGEKFGHLKYLKNRGLQDCFVFYFSKKNNRIYCLENLDKIKKSIKWSKIIFKGTFILLIIYSLFFAYLVSVSDTAFDFFFAFFFGVITFILAIFFPQLSFAIDQTSIFLENFYAAEKLYKKIKEKEDQKLLEEKSKSIVNNYSLYTRSKY